MTKEGIKRRCPVCRRYLPIETWPCYKGRMYAYCTDCKRDYQREWARRKNRWGKRNLEGSPT
jgi:7-cyano-7-deazaguanine synthase in queuosine biosynthesis